LIVLSHFQASQIIQNRGGDPSLEISLDLGLSKQRVILGDKVLFPGGDYLSWEQIESIAKNQNNCFEIEAGSAVTIQEYSKSFGRVYTLYPTASAPTMLVSGIPMHRIKDTDPWTDTRQKLKAFGRVGGHVLDTTTGLGYTAIMAAEHAAQVTTVELDPAAQEIAKSNPWSRELFTNPKITQRIGDSAELIETFEDKTFSGIIHDPPMFSLAGELYSLDFYEGAYRVLKPNGRIFHYIGNPKSRSGSRVTRGVVERLRFAGFKRVISSPQAFGVTAYK
jgi:predicted methyltransferase